MLSLFNSSSKTNNKIRKEKHLANKIGEIPLFSIIWPSTFSKEVGNFEFDLFWEYNKKNNNLFHFIHSLEKNED
jgi:hypothetical protein